MNTPYIYEVLIRGSVTGIRGAHVIRAVESINVLTNESRIDTGIAEPIALGEELEDILGTVATTALAENAQLQAQVQQLTTDLSEAQAEISRLQAQIANSPRE